MTTHDGASRQKTHVSALSASLSSGPGPAAASGASPPEPSDVDAEASPLVAAAASAGETLLRPPWEDDAPSSMAPPSPATAEDPFRAPGDGLADPVTSAKRMREASGTHSIT